jgi:hypothetical protein
MRNNVYGGAVCSCAGVQREIQGTGNTPQAKSHPKQNTKFLIFDMPLQGGVEIFYEL